MATSRDLGYNSGSNIPEPGLFAMQSSSFFLTFLFSSPRFGALMLGACVMLLVGLTEPARAQMADDITLYSVTDVSVDITADNAAHARDKAIAEAQRSALEQLLTRFGADPSLAGKLANDDIASLVQNFEVQNERVSAVRYIGTFAVQFRPVATRDWLTKSGASFTETRSKPILILPVLMNKGHAILWEEHTRWWGAWETAPNTGLVPIMLPSSGLDDIAVLSSEEAMNGDTHAMKALIDKYSAGGAAVIILDGSLDTPGTPFKISITRYDTEGTAGIPNRFELPPASDKAGIDSVLTQAVRQSRGVLEGSWRQVMAKAAQTPAAKLSVSVPISSIDEWTAIRKKLGSVHAIEKTNVVTLARGMTTIELEYRGNIQQLQEELAQQKLSLVQDSMNATWVLQDASGTRP